MRSKKDKHSGYIIAYTTAEKRADAETMAGAIIDEGLAACVNIVPGLTSLYKWNGKKVRTKEFLLIIKTHRRALAMLEKKLKALSPYELPEFISIDIVYGSDDYLQWIYKAVKPR